MYVDTEVYVYKIFDLMIKSHFFCPVCSFDRFFFYKTKGAEAEASIMKIIVLTMIGQAYRKVTDTMYIKIFYISLYNESSVKTGFQNTLMSVKLKTRDKRKS